MDVNLLSKKINMTAENRFDPLTIKSILNDTRRGYIRVLRRGQISHRQAKSFEFKFFYVYEETVKIPKAGKRNQVHSWSICLTVQF